MVCTGFPDTTHSLLMNEPNFLGKATEGAAEKQRLKSVDETVLEAVDSILLITSGYCRVQVKL